VGPGAAVDTVIVAVKKVKLFLCLNKHYATKTCWGSEDLASCVLKHGGEWSASL